MGAIDRFVMHVNHAVKEEPEKGWNEMRLGFKLNRLRTVVKPKKNISRGYQLLEKEVMSLVSDCLGNEDEYVWSNIFAPVEIMECFGLKTLSVETLSALSTGYGLESYFIDKAESCGIATPLCSFHKGFIGAFESGALHAPGYAVTTSLSCDGNLNTFRYLKEKAGVPYCFIDVPARSDESSVRYVRNQLMGLASELEKRTGKPFDENKLRSILEVENETRAYIKEFFKLEGEHYYPGELISHMFMFMATHLLIGTTALRDLMKAMVKDIKTYPEFTGERILWGHVLPFYQESLREKFEGSREFQLISSDIVMDNTEMLDVSDPFTSLARKLINNIYNLPYEEKTEAMVQLAKDVKADGMIYFCHWGCKQVAGGSVLMKEAMQNEGIQTLILDGDSMDRRNNQDGQIKTRLEAFLELLKSRGGRK